MKPITINITNLVGTITVAGDVEKASVQIQELVTDALLKVINTATTEAPAKDYSKAKNLLQDLIETASRAIIAIDENKPHWEICNIAEEEIEELYNQISSAILGKCTPIVNPNADIVQ